MTPFVRSLLPEEDINLFEKIRIIVQAFPDNLDLGKDSKNKPVKLSCHILAHALGRPFTLEVKDGYFHPHYEHSWLETRNGHIIDVYPVGILGGPFLIE